ncbi:MAG: glycoside hydrolase family 13 protein [Lachnospiraceae bacterium]
MNERKLDDILYIQKYLYAKRPLLKRKALFTDTTEEYLIPNEPNPFETVKIRFRTARFNVDGVYVYVNGEKLVMEFESNDETFDYYMYEYNLGDIPVSYYFKVRLGRVYGFYDTRGLSTELEEEYFFKIYPGFNTPKWAKGAVMYQLYVDRFYNGDKSNDVLSKEYYYIDDYVTRVEKWDKYPASMGVREFYGGDLQGVLDKMDYLEGLGIDAIYFNPLFVSPSNHKYDIQDYDYIDPHIGKIVDEKGEILSDGTVENRFATKYINRVTNKANLEASNALFAQVVEEAHKRGIKVILDGVFNHCGSFNKWIDKERIYENAEGYKKGAYITKDSPYHDYFKFYDKGSDWPYNEDYDGWWGHNTLPKLNYEESKTLESYILYIAKKWVSPPYNVDGWRLDVAADLGHSPEYNHGFWKKFRDIVKDANPEAIILAEHYGDAKSWLQGDEWDTIMNYDAFMEPITWFLTGMQKHSDSYSDMMLGNSDAFWGSMRYYTLPTPSSSVSMNELSNHDHSRFLTRTNKCVGRTATMGPEAANIGVNKAVLREAVVMQMTWPGAPTIYYGDEAGLCGFTDPDNRRTYPWGEEDIELVQFHRDIIAIHKQYQELKTGSILSLLNDYNFMAYGRFDKYGASAIIINNNQIEVHKKVSIWELDIPKNCNVERIMLTTNKNYSVGKVKMEVVRGNLDVIMPPVSAMIVRYDKTVESALASTL